MQDIVVRCVIVVKLKGISFVILCLAEQQKGNFVGEMVTTAECGGIEIYFMCTMIYKTQLKRTNVARF
jgi:hypothetical protein